jgi:hypothetical protein
MEAGNPEVRVQYRQFLRTLFLTFDIQLLIASSHERDIIP